MHRLAVFVSASTLFLIFVGGLVTSTGSGLAVPDWPLSYGQVFPPMVGGVLYEHGHRMVAAAVGFLTLVLSIWLAAREPRRWVSRLGAAALLAVILQGVLGGITVLFLLPTVVSVAHACLAQAFLCLTVVLAVVTGPHWKAPAAWADHRPSAGTGIGLHALTLATAGAVYIQLILGAVMRHTGAGLAIPDFPLAFGRLIPPLASPPVAIHFAHRLGALAVSVLVVWVAARVLKRHGGEPALVRPVLAMLGLLATQIGLGAATVLSGKAVLPTTAHVACGAALLATGILLALRSYRLSPGIGGASAEPRTAANLGGEVTTA